MPRPRLGHIQFINCLPLYYGMVKQDVLLDVDLVRANPADLAEMIVASELEVAPIPAIEYARHADELVLLPDIAISSDGDVQSILLISKVPVENLSGRVVALAANSRTSQVLARILLERYWQVTPRYVMMPPDLPAMLRDADAALLIGDEALREHWHPTHDLIDYDLGRAWKQWTGLPMVYAVWAVRRTFAESQPETVAQISSALTTSLDYCRCHLDEIAQYAARWEPFAPSQFRSYFDALEFRYGSPYREGMRRFLSEAVAIDQLPAVPDLRVFGEA